MSDLSELDALLHIIDKKVLVVLRYQRLYMCRSIILLGNDIIKCSGITHSAKETRQKKEQWEWGLEITGKGGGGGGWTKFLKGGM